MFNQDTIILDERYISSNGKILRAVKALEQEIRNPRALFEHKSVLCAFSDLFPSPPDGDFKDFDEYFDYLGGRDENEKGPNIFGPGYFGTFLALEKTDDGLTFLRIVSDEPAEEYIGAICMKYRDARTFEEKYGNEWMQAAIETMKYEIREYNLFINKVVYALHMVDAESGELLESSNNIYCDFDLEESLKESGCKIINN